MHKYKNGFLVTLRHDDPIETGGSEQLLDQFALVALIHSDGPSRTRSHTDDMGKPNVLNQRGDSVTGHPFEIKLLQLCQHEQPQRIR